MQKPFFRIQTLTPNWKSQTNCVVPLNPQEVHGSNTPFARFRARWPAGKGALLSPSLCFLNSFLAIGVPVENRKLVCTLSGWLQLVSDVHVTFYAVQRLFFIWNSRRRPQSWEILNGPAALRSYWSCRIGLPRQVWPQYVSPPFPFKIAPAYAVQFHTIK